MVTPEAPLAAGEDARHCDYLRRGKVILMRWPERHINHSCAPNTYVRTIGGVRRVLALRGIAENEEITYDYCLNGYGDTVWHCSCGASSCRRVMHSDFFHLPLALQRQYVCLLDDWYVEDYRDMMADLLKSQLSLEAAELIGYTGEERDKWERWLGGQPPEATRAAVQTSGRFTTVWALMDHVFLAEKRHTQRIQRESPLAQATNVAEGDTPALFAFARAERTGFEGLVNSIRPDEAAQVRDFEMAGAVYRVTPRKLIFHTLIHEVRHWAQIATALRNAGFDPPGQHDLLFTNTLR